MVTYEKRSSEFMCQMNELRLGKKNWDVVGGGGYSFIEEVRCERGGRGQENFVVSPSWTSDGATRINLEYVAAADSTLVLGPMARVAGAGIYQPDWIDLT